MKIPTYTNGHAGTFWIWNCGWNCYKLHAYKEKPILVSSRPLGHLEYQKLSKHFPHACEVNKRDARICQLGRRPMSSDWRRISSSTTHYETPYEHIHGDVISNIGHCRLLLTDGVHAIVYSYGREQKFEVHFTNLRECRPNKTKTPKAPPTPKAPKSTFPPSTNLTTAQQSRINRILESVNLDDLL